MTPATATPTANIGTLTDGSRAPDSLTIAVAVTVSNKTCVVTVHCYRRAYHGSRMEQDRGQAQRYGMCEKEK